MTTPFFNEQMRNLGIDGMEVFDEQSVSGGRGGFNSAGHTRRSAEQVTDIVRLIDNPRIDVIVLYTVYARAVDLPRNSDISLLHLTLNYRALSVRDGRFLGGGRLTTDKAGIVFKACAARLEGKEPDPHCVVEFISGEAEKLASEAGSTLAVKLASFASAYVGRRQRESNEACGNVPTRFKVVFQSFGPREVDFIEEHMNSWQCKLDMDVTRQTGASIAFEYKTKANSQRLSRNIRKMLRRMGLIGTFPKTQGRNEIVVKAQRLLTK